MRKILWIMWLTLSCSQSSCLERKDRLISATESSFSSMLSDTELSDSDWLSPESTAVGMNNCYYQINVLPQVQWQSSAYYQDLTLLLSLAALLLPGCKLFCVCERTEECCEGVFWDVLIVIALVCHFPGARPPSTCVFTACREKKCVNYTQHLISQDQLRSI